MCPEYGCAIFFGKQTIFVISLKTATSLVTQSIKALLPQ